MPYMKLETNVDISEAKAETLLKELSAAMAEATGKPESVVQVGLAGGVSMIMAGTTEPAVHMEAEGFGFRGEHARAMWEQACAIVVRELGVPGRRIYLAFTAFKGAMWGVDGRTY